MLDARFIFKLLDEMTVPVQPFTECSVRLARRVTLPKPALRALQSLLDLTERHRAIGGVR